MSFAYRRNLYQLSDNQLPMNQRNEQKMKKEEIKEETVSPLAERHSNNRQVFDPLQVFISLRLFFKHLISLEEDKADEQATIAYIKRGVVFRGSNLWILICAIFIASIGLNVNSTAVIIGAMLISPLMGPIIGVGLGIGINDLELIKKGLFNLAIAATISVLTSTLYFWLTPIDDAQSELLARTTPTIWDVLIAFFGGLTGIIANSRMEKSNAIPGVAIATALMPPLCTAGFGLATGQFIYFFGAFYLFFINSVFICLATFVIVRYLGYPQKKFEDLRMEKRVKHIILFFVVLTILPSLYTGYTVVQKSIFEHNATDFIRQELSFPQTQVISRNFEYTSKQKRIEVILLGRNVADSIIERKRKSLVNYRLKHTKLVVHQGYYPDSGANTFNPIARNTEAIQQLYKKNEEALKEKDNQIARLQAELYPYKSIPLEDIEHEIKVEYPQITNFAFSHSLITRMDSMRSDTVYLAYARFRRHPKSAEVTQLREWLRVRTKVKSLKLFIE